MYDMDHKMGLFSVLLILAVALTGCSSEDPEPPNWDKPAGYFQTMYGTPLDLIVGCEAGALEIPMKGNAAETVIPIAVISEDVEYAREGWRYKWSDLMHEGLVLKPELQYVADGYQSYPNSLDYTYTYKWLTCATFKEQSSENGVMKISYESNPYNAERFMTVYLSNESTGTLNLWQEANPDGIDLTTEK